MPPPASTAKSTVPSEKKTTPIPFMHLINVRVYGKVPLCHGQDLATHSNTFK